MHTLTTGEVYVAASVGKCQGSRIAGSRRGFDKVWPGNIAISSLRNQGNSSYPPLSGLDTAAFARGNLTQTDHLSFLMMTRCVEADVVSPGFTIPGGRQR